MNAESDWYRDTGQLLDEIRGLSDEFVSPAIDGYSDLTEIGRGGQGVVYRALQRSTGRTVAVKVLLEGALASESAQSRFEREIEIVADLRHPNIVQIFDSGMTTDGRRFYSMEFVEGEPFGTGTGDSKGERDAMLATFAKVCDAVGHAHLRGVIHRDLKPGNVRIDADREPRVLDFGLAKPDQLGTVSEAPTKVSITGQFLGSLPWASPEQVTSDSSGLDVRSDVYALGVMLYAALTGAMPHDTSGPLRDVLDRIASSDPPPPSSIDRTIDGDLTTITLRCLARDPERRYQSAIEVAREIRHYLAGEPIEAKRDSAMYTIRKTLARHRVATGAALAAIVVLLGVSIVMALLLQRALGAESLAESRLADLEEEANKVALVNEYLLGAFSPQGDADQRTVQEMLTDAALRIEESLAGQDEVKGEVHNALSYWYSTYGMMDLAEQQQRLSLELRRASYGENDARLIENHSSLSYLAHSRGEYDTAAMHATRRVEILTSAGEPDTEDISNALGWLSEMHLRNGDAIGAESAARECLAVREADADTDPFLLPLTRGMIACTLAAQGRIDEADPMLTAAHGAVVQEMGADHNVVRWLSEIAALAYTQGGGEPPV